MDFNPEIFRQYDIRGVYGRDFDEDFAFKLGAAFVKYLNRRRILVARDDRKFSESLASSLAGGVASAGGDVYDLGLSTLPLFNFAFKKLGVEGGIMVTASHNPPEYGGFKLYDAKNMPISSGFGLEDIKNLMDNQDLEISRQAGQISRLDGHNLLADYLNFVIKKSSLKPGELEKIKIKIESPNEIVAGEISLLFKKLGIENSESEFDIAFSFDGDADRLKVTDENRELLNVDYLVALLARDQTGFFSKPKVVHDLRFSKNVLERFEKWGIKSFRSKVGRTNIKRQMVKKRADLGGELSGHLFFKEINYNEAPLLAALRLARIIVRSDKTMSQLVSEFQSPWFSSGEVNLDTIAGDEIMAKLKEKYSDGKIDQLDGLTVEYPDWWFNIRPSSTEPLTRLVTEAKSKDLLEEKIEEILNLTKGPSSL